MKKIETLVADIHTVFRDWHDFDEERLERFGKRLAKAVANKVNAVQGKSRLRLSNLGTKCDKKLWYSINQPNNGEELPVEARIKFLYGDVLEELLLFLAEEAGHTVEGTQDEVLLHGIVGHRDAVIDGVLVDCKSASTMAFQKFKNHLTYDEDAFGYIDQLQGYLEASQNDPIVKDKKRAAFLVIDKTLGHITLDMHKKSDLDYKKLVEMKQAAIAQEQPPRRYYADEPDGKSGNRKLSTQCGYCQFKRACWPGLRTFLYARGPVYLTRVERLPDVKEV